MQDQARAVIIGSGIAGSSIAYHLAERGWRDIVILEQGPLFSGTTSHAPGLVGQLRASVPLTKMLMDSVALYRKLEVEGARGFFEVGSLRLASSPVRLAELKRQAAFAQSVGLAAELITAQEAHRLFPLMELAGVEGALYVPSDGSARAVVLAEALNRAAQAQGAVCRSRARVTGIEVSHGRVQAVQTAQGRLRTDIVIAATGIWSPRVGQLAGVSVPLQPMQHQVVWTEPLPELSETAPLPNLRDPDRLVYYRQDGTGLAMGGYERDPASFAVEAIPDSDNPTSQPFDAARFAPLMEGACVRVPRLREARLARQLNGIESFTPDGEFLLGEAPEVGGFWLACGFCAHGVSGAGGVGKVLAEWIVEGKPGVDLSHMDIRRFGGQSLTPAELLRRVTAIYSTYYDISSLPADI